MCGDALEQGGCPWQGEVFFTESDGRLDAPTTSNTPAACTLGGELWLPPDDGSPDSICDRMRVTSDMGSEG